MGTPFSASGLMNELKTPTSEKENGPSILRHAQGVEGLCSSGTLSAGQTIESSSAVRVTDAKGALQAQPGIGALAGSRQTANRPWIRENLSARLVMSDDSVVRPSAYDLAAAASNKFRNANFFSAGRNDASKELRANSRKCSSVKPKVS